MMLDLTLGWPEVTGFRSGTCRRHAAFYADMAVAADPHVDGHAAAAWLPRLDRDRPNIQQALAWLKRNRLLEHRARFDVVAILWPENSKTPEIRHYRNAFEAVGRGQMYS